MFKKLTLPLLFAAAIAVGSLILEEQRTHRTKVSHSRVLHPECLELTDIINKAAETGQYYDKSGQLMRQPDLRKQIPRDDLERFKKNVRIKAGEIAKRDKIDMPHALAKVMHGNPEDKVEFLRDLNCSSLNA